MIDPATIWREVMDDRAAKRQAALAAGKTSADHATRDFALCDLFLYLCVDRREQDDQFVTLHPGERQDVAEAIAIAVRIAERTEASGDPRAEALWQIARPARAAMTLLQSALDARAPA